MLASERVAGTVAGGAVDSNGIADLDDSADHADPAAGCTDRGVDDVVGAVGAVGVVDAVAGRKPDNGSAAAVHCS